VSVKVKTRYETRTKMDKLQTRNAAAAIYYQ